MIEAICIDYDGTWTLHPALFRSFVHGLLDAGYTVVMVTQRAREHAEAIWKDEEIEKLIPVIYCPGEPKAVAVVDAGYYPILWIEDNPEAIYTPLRYIGPETQEEPNGETTEGPSEASEWPSDGSDGAGEADGARGPSGPGEALPGATGGDPEEGKGGAGSREN